MDNSEVATSDTYGIYQGSGTSTITASNIHNDGYGVYGQGAGTITLTNNTFANNSTFTGYFNLSSGLTVVHSGNAATGSGGRGLYMNGTLGGDQTWAGGDGLPYAIPYGVTVPAGKTLTLGEGAVVKVGVGWIKLDVSGILNVQGTSASSVYITSLRDDSAEVKGDTDGDSTTAAAGNWDGIKFESGASSTITYGFIRYGGYTGCCYGAGADIFNAGGNVTIASSSIVTSVSYLIYQTSGTTTITNSDLYNASYAAYLTTAGALSIASSRIHKSASQGIYADSSGSVTLTNNTFYNNTANPAYANFSNGLSLTTSGNTSSGTEGHGIYVNGTISTDQTWTADTLPYVIPYGITVASNKTLRINAGAILKFDSAVGLTISSTGTLAVAGTSGSKVYFTSIKDDSVGGDVNDDGSSGSHAPAAGNWDEIKLNSGASSTIANAVVRYGDYGSNEGEVYNNGGILTLDTVEVATSSNYGIYQASGSATIYASYIHHNPYGVYFAGGAINVSESALYQNSSYALYNSTGNSIGVAHNWWGDSTGPYPQGVGDHVSANVDPSPWHHNDYWWSVRSSGLKWYYGGALYANDLDAATFNWNSTTSGMGIILVSSTSPMAAANIAISDETTTTPGVLGVTVGHTAASGIQDTMRLFSNNITDVENRHDWTWRRWVMIHELGHALGLGHSDPGDIGTDVMYYDDQGTIDFGTDDTYDYNFVWSTFKWATSYWWP